jgi:hypothetical protein
MAVCTLHAVFRLASLDLRLDTPLESSEIQYVRRSQLVWKFVLTTRQGVRAYMQQSRIFVGMVLILIFGEVLGLYG